MAIFERDSARRPCGALGQVRVLTIDKKNLLRQNQRGPLDGVSPRAGHVANACREMSAELAQLKSQT